MIQQNLFLSSIYLQQDTPASLSLRQEDEKESKMRDIYGLTLDELLQQDGPLGVFSRMLLDTKLWDSTRSYPTWHQKATPANRSLFQLVPLERHTGETVSGLLPTPLASDSIDRGNLSNPSAQRRLDLGKQVGLSYLFKGTPCPTCVENMMGYPEGWTNV